jgi:uncharacterized protein
MRGSIFENLIISELMKNSYNKGLPGNYYFWRDRSGNEVDCIVEHGEKLQPLEIKSGQTLNTDFIKGLKKREVLAGENSINPVLIYGGDDSLEYHNIIVSSCKDRKLFDLIYS